MRPTKTPSSGTSEANDLQLAFAEARFGVTVEEFLSSDIGRYLMGRADADLEDARTQLETVPPEQLKAAQLKAAVPRAFKSWLEDALTNGHVAEDYLRRVEEDY